MEAESPADPLDSLTKYEKVEALFTGIGGRSFIKGFGSDVPIEIDPNKGNTINELYQRIEGEINGYTPADVSDFEYSIRGILKMDRQPTTTIRMGMLMELAIKVGERKEQLRRMAPSEK